MAGIYIHIPLCRCKCLYCDFYSCAREELREPLVAAIVRELELRCGFFVAAAAGRPEGGSQSVMGWARTGNGTASACAAQAVRPGREARSPSAAPPPSPPLAGGSAVETIYIGGGTPSLLAPPQIGTLIAAVKRLWDCSALCEVTVEVNPDDVDEKYLCELAAQGVDRLSIGVQSFADRDLRLLGRRHDARKAREAVVAAQRAGFGNISIDLIYGIPGMMLQDWDANLREAVGLGVQHISAYHLTVEAETPLGAMAARGEFFQIGEQESREQFDLLRGRLIAAGYEHYEISNFAKPGYRAVHNGNYWNGESYLGAGPSAHSYDGERRSWNAPDIDRYLAGADISSSETLTPQDKYNEYVMTSLRTGGGIEAVTLSGRFGEEFASHFDRCARRLVETGLLMCAGGRYRIDPANWFVSDQIIASLFFA